MNQEVSAACLRIARTADGKILRAYLLSQREVAVSTMLRADCPHKLRNAQGQTVAIDKLANLIDPKT